MLAPAIVFIASFLATLTILLGVIVCWCWLPVDPLPQIPASSVVPWCQPSIVGRLPAVLPDVAWFRRPPPVVGSVRPIRYVGTVVDRSTSVEVLSRGMGFHSHVVSSVARVGRFPHMESLLLLVVFFPVVPLWRPPPCRWSAVWWTRTCVGPPYVVARLCLMVAVVLRFAVASPLMVSCPSCSSAASMISAPHRSNLLTLAVLTSSAVSGELVY